MTPTGQSANAPFGIADRFNPFSAEYLADPYPILSDVREAAPVFYSADLDHWVVTRYPDVRQILRTAASFSAVNALEPLTKLCPRATAVLKDGGYAATPALTNLDPPGHARQRRLTNVAFTPKRVEALEPFIRDLAGRFCDERFRDGQADMISDLAWALPALVLFRVLGLPDSDLIRVKEGAHYRGVVIFGRASEDKQIGAARELAGRGEPRAARQQRAYHLACDDRRAMELQLEHLLARVAVRSRETNDDRTLPRSGWCDGYACGHASCCTEGRCHPFLHQQRRIAGDRCLRQGIWQARRDLGG